MYLPKKLCTRVLGRPPFMGASSKVYSHSMNNSMPYRRRGYVDCKTHHIVRVSITGPERENKEEIRRVFIASHDVIYIYLYTYIYIDMPYLTAYEYIYIYKVYLHAHYDR